MSKIKLLKEPGYVYDLIFAFCLNFNKKDFIEELPENKREEGAKHFESVLSLFGEIPEDLYVFFLSNENGRAFLPKLLFYPYIDRFATDYNFKFILDAINDSNYVVRELIRFYFFDLDNEEIDECCGSLEKLFDYIKKSEYTSEVKSKLYEFFVNPEPYIRTLRYELMQKETVLSDYYKNNYQEIINVYNQTSVDIITEQFFAMGNDNKIVIPENSDICASFCLLNKYHLGAWLAEHYFCFVLGCEYESLLNPKCGETIESRLNNLGVALSEQSRVDILNVIMKKGEIICKDLEKEFDFSGSTAYHHITILTRCGLLKTRNEGKTILYSINKKFFVSVMDELKKYTITRKENK